MTFETRMARLEEIAAEQHLRLSASAMARFIRELFGERMEPWKELPDDAEISITVNGSPRSVRDAGSKACAERIPRRVKTRYPRGE